jgi:hypothetical protein
MCNAFTLHQRTYPASCKHEDDEGTSNLRSSVIRYLQLATSLLPLNLRSSLVYPLYLAVLVADHQPQTTSVYPPHGRKWTNKSITFNLLLSVLVPQPFSAKRNYTSLAYGNVCQVWDITCKKR